MKTTIKQTNNILVVDKRTRKWCTFPYPGHPKGCPNYNKSKECPGKVDLIQNVFDLEKPNWFIIIEFNIGEFAVKMKTKHPNWTNKQARCCLYWQNSVRKKLRIKCNELILNKDRNYTLLPEAMGVNVFRTCHRLGIKMRKNPQNIFYKVAFVGTYKKEYKMKVFKENYVTAKDTKIVQMGLFE